MTSDDEFLREKWSQKDHESEIELDKDKKAVSDFAKRKEDSLMQSANDLVDLSELFQHLRDWHMSNVTDNVAYSIQEIVNHLNLYKKMSERKTGDTGGNVDVHY